MDSFKGKMKELTQSVKTDLKVLGPDHIRAFGSAIGNTLNPNHRHDEKHEKEIDAQIMEIRAEHRYTSFAPETEGNLCKYHVDGHDFFWAVSELFENAKESIFILDWWLTPELYLRRPAYKYPEYRIDRLLKRKAEEGVKIYIIVYKEVAATMSMSSRHTKHALEDLHDNIAVMRHPDHSGGEITLYWSHHEKLTIVDSHYATVGGLDLCFGRWDTNDHPLADVHPTDWDKTIFPGQDYNNARVMDFQNVDDYCSNAVAVELVPRMPWHDNHVTMIGQAVVDLTQHFVERWNFVKNLKYKHDKRYDWLALPHPFDTPLAQHQPDTLQPVSTRDSHYRDGHARPTDIPRNATNFAEQQAEVDAEKEEVEDEVRRADRRRRHPHLQAWADRGHAWCHPYHEKPSQEPKWDVEVEKGSCDVQVLRSSADWSHGILLENSIQMAYIQLIREANHCIYIENQFFITNTTPGRGPVKNLIGAAIVERVLSAAQSGKKFKIFILIPEAPAFPGDIQGDGSLRAIMGAQYKSINRGDHSIFGLIKAAGYDPNEYISFYNLRSYDRVNAPKSFIKDMEQRSRIKFHEAQVALARIWIGSENTDGVDTDDVMIKTAGDDDGGVNKLEDDKVEKELERVKMPKTIEEAESIIKRFQDAATRPDECVSDNVGQHSQADSTTLDSEKWLGTEEEERNAYISEICYIHSKLMIIDDRVVIIGSSNLNDRSMCGDHDSEIAMVIEDKEPFESKMDGKKYIASKFASAWRRTLCKEHLGLLPPKGTHNEGEYPNDNMHPVPVPGTNDPTSEADQIVMDPIGDEFIALWKETAKRNRKIFDDIFVTFPSDRVKTWKDYDTLLPSGIASGHIANKELTIAQVKDQLSQIRGHLVEMPLEFLSEEKELINWDDIAAVNSLTMDLYL